MCRAIALAEGANSAGNAADRYNNPGDLGRGDEHGQTVTGYVTLPDGEILIIFATKEGGWQALYQKIANIAAGTSSAYSPQMTWRQIGQRYAGNSATWTANVTRVLGVSPDSRFGDYFAAIDPGSPEILTPDVPTPPPAMAIANVDLSSIPAPILIAAVIVAGVIVLPMVVDQLFD